MSKGKIKLCDLARVVGNEGNGEAVIDIAPLRMMTQRIDRIAHGLHEIHGFSKALEGKFAGEFA